MGVLVLSSRCSWYVCWHEVDNTLGALDIRDARIQGLFLPAQARAKRLFYPGGPHRCGCLDSTRCWFATDVRCLERFPEWR
jgi:hypothetical protein